MHVGLWDDVQRNFAYAQMGRAAMHALTRGAIAAVVPGASAHCQHRNAGDEFGFRQARPVAHEGPM